jgi:SAM-dependent methyltransferase
MKADIDATVVTMRDTWNYLANENAKYHIASEEQNWKESDFFSSGERDVARHLDPVLARFGFDPQGKKLLEIGCGVGRMSFNLAKRFGEVDAVDISPEMIKRADEYKEKFGATNVHFHLGGGKDLAGFGMEHFDFCFSYIVFQHIPSVELIFDYVREVGRVLKPGGMFLFQVNGYPHLRLPRSKYVMWGVRGTGRLRRWGIGRRPFLHVGRLNLMAGVPIKRSSMLHVCESVRLDTKEIIGVGTQYMWFAGTKAIIENGEIHEKNHKM